MIMLLVTLGQD